MAELCTKGCLKDNKPAWHTKRADCPHYIAPVPDPTPAAEPKAPSAPQATRPEPENEPGKKKSGGLNLTGGTPQITKDRTPSQPIKADVDYLVDGPHAKTFVQTTYTIVEWGCLGLDKFLRTEEIKKEGFAAHIPHEVFTLSDREARNIDMDPKDYYIRGATWIAKRFGCKTKEQAHAFIDGYGLITNFGTVLFAVAAHFITAFRESPRFAEDRRKKELAKQAKHAARVSYTQRAEPIPIPITTPGTTP